MFNNKLADIQKKIDEFDQVIKQYEEEHPRKYPEHEQYKALKSHRKGLTMQRQRLLEEQYSGSKQPIAPPEDQKSSGIVPR